MTNEKNWLTYYKNSLSDSENLAIDVSKIKHLYHQNISTIHSALLHSKNSNELLDVEERRINRIKGVTKKEDPKWRQVNTTKILISPFHLTYNSANSKMKSIHPFWITASVNRSGELSVSNDIFPLIVRNYVTPIADVKNDFIFTSINTILDSKDIPAPELESENDNMPWDAYWSYINTVFSEITSQNLESYKAEGYDTIHKVTYFALSSKIATAKSILFLYEHLINNQTSLPVLSKVLNSVTQLKKEAITNDDFLKYNHLHLGQMSNEFPLSVSQRKTLLSYLSAENNAITAVNGPPGTGKTTLLQSLVATEFVKSALLGEDAPVILACSNNNQAVTNIIDSFINSESNFGHLSERWIPNFNGYATYLPSNSKRGSALTGINYLNGNMFGNEGTLCDLENEDYLRDAEYYFLTQFCTYYNAETNSLDDSSAHLQYHIKELQNALEEGVSFSTNHIEALKKINTVLLDSKNHITEQNFNLSTVKNWRTICTTLKAASNKGNFNDRIKRYFHNNETTIEGDGHQLFSIPNAIIDNPENILGYLNTLISNFNMAIQSHLQLKEWKFEHQIKGFPITSEILLWESEYEKLNSRNASQRFYYDELDVALRHKAFLLATHYWEARWLMATKEMLEHHTEKGTGEVAVSSKWKRRAMLTPCFVATFYMAPSHFLYSQFQGENAYGSPIFEYLPLYNFLDLLIIDEAGQVTPEVSIPMFALAKKAFVIGDLKQIEPIWSIPSKIDIGNLSVLGLLEHNESLNQLDSLGFLASSGSVMKMAQNACEYETSLDNLKEPGLVLLEHRRCNDEIINFCNELAYNGTLKPMKGPANDHQIFPSMMAYHVEGVSERKYNSRHNQNEVNAIIRWLQQHKDKIKTAYKVNSIEELLGIITPFASQKRELSIALSDAGLNVNAIKLGTVHALQGAERHIILFSSVYTNSDEGSYFFEKDNKPNMLNVAVSRAKESFILFGDTRIFDDTKNTPSGILKKHLTVHELEL